MVTFRRPKYLRDTLIKAKIPTTPKKRDSRQITGMNPCNKTLCETCPFIKKMQIVQRTFNDTTVQINSTVTCTSTNVVYCLLCSKENSKQLYVGQTQRQLKERFGEHKTSIRTKSNNTIGEYFNCPRHYLADINILAILKVYSKDQRINEKRKSLWITKLEANWF